MAADQVSATRLYLGGLPRDVTKPEIEEHFASHAGTIKEVKLMSGFGFLEFTDELDARDVVPAFHGSELKGQRITVQFARGPKRKDEYGSYERQAPRPRRTIYRMTITDLQPETSWQDLKDFARTTAQLDVVYSETSRGEGKGFVEFENANDLKTAVEKCNGQEFKGSVLTCIADIQDERDIRSYRQRTPPPNRGGRYGHDEYYERRGPPRGYSPRGYRELSPGRRRPPPDDYYARGYERRSPPRDYGPPPPRRYDDHPYDPRGPPPPPMRNYGDPYARGGDPYARPPRSPGPPRGYGYGGYGGYDDRRY